MMRSSRPAALAALAALALGATLAITACGSGSDSSKPTPAGTGKVTYLGKESIPKDPAQRVFQQVCLSCHATGVGPVITGRNLPPEAVKLFVRNGNRAMPAFTEAMLDDETLDGIARIVATSKAPATPAAQ